MMGAYHILAAVLFLVVVIREGLALKCVQCNSFTKPECDSQPSEFEDDCPFNATSCRKMEQEIKTQRMNIKVYYDDDYQVRTIRQCALESGPLKCIERTGTYRFKVYYCHCQGDNCNTASSLTLSVTLALVSAAVASLFKL